MFIIISLIKKLRWPSGCLIFLLSCHTVSTEQSVKTFTDDTNAKKIFIEKAFVEIAKSEKLIHSGDIITRTGNDFTSQTLKNFNQRDKTFSHCGIASIENDTVFVYHAIGGDFNPDQKIRRDPFTFFAQPYSNNEIGIFRFKLSDSNTAKLVMAAKDFYAKAVMFDMDFSLETNDRMYCAEFVYKSLMKADNKLIFPLSHIGKFTFIGVDDIFLHPMCKNEYHLIYK